MTKIENYKAKFPLLHAIRGVAAMYVVIYHAKFILWSGGTEYLAKYPRSQWLVVDYLKFGIDLFTTAGSEMVMIFFVLSGFFIAMSLQNAKGSFVQRLQQFYVVRIIRIYTPYIASIIIGVAVLLWIRKFAPGLYHADTHREFNNRLITANQNLDFSNFLKALLFLKNGEYIGFNFAYWSLLYEGIFYLIVPFVFLRKQVYLFVSLLLLVSGAFIVNRYHPGHIFMRYLFEYNFYFALGQFIYIYKEQILSKFDGRNYKPILLTVTFGLFILFDVLALAKQHFWAGIAAGISAFCLIVVFLKYEFKKNWFIKGIIKLGEISYSLYLVHLPVLIFMYVLIFKYSNELVFYNRIWYVTGILVSVIAGIILYRLVEKPSMNIINQVKKNFKK
ncbi:MAG: acyltransferase [Chitinophagaceae bacterium]|nr:acyltransferase [Chitinophagaceae bacterium]